MANNERAKNGVRVAEEKLPVFSSMKCHGKKFIRFRITQKFTRQFQFCKLLSRRRKMGGVIVQMERDRHRERYVV